MIFWNQLEGNNIEVDGFDAAGSPKTPTYNEKLGFSNGWFSFFCLNFVDVDAGAQPDIFLGSGTATGKTVPSNDTYRVSSVGYTFFFLLGLVLVTMVK
jgi:hypothetical protein